MFEELQLQIKPKRPKPIKSILGDRFVDRLFGVISPSKYFMLHYKLNLSDEERLYLEAESEYFESLIKYKVYKRQATNEEWYGIYRKYRMKQTTNIVLEE